MPFKESACIADCLKAVSRTRPGMEHVDAPHTSRYERNVARDSGRQHNGHHFGHNYYNYHVFCSHAARVLIADRAPDGFAIHTPPPHTSENRYAPIAVRQASRKKAEMNKRASKLLRKYAAWKKLQDTNRARSKIPREPAVLLAAPILYEDLSGATVELPYEYFCRWATLHAHLQCIFESRAGVDFIRRLAFIFVRIGMKSGRPFQFEPEKWEDHVVPGMRVGAMMLFLDRSQDSSQPCACGSSRREIDELNEVVACADCGETYNFEPFFARNTTTLGSNCKVQSGRRFPQNAGLSDVQTAQEASCFKGVIITKTNYATDVTTSSITPTGSESRARVQSGACVGKKTRVVPCVFGRAVSYTCNCVAGYCSCDTESFTGRRGVSILEEEVKLPAWRSSPDPKVRVRVKPTSRHRRTWRDLSPFSKRDKG